MTTPITLDKVRNIRFRMRAQSLIEKHFEKKPPKGEITLVVSTL